MIRHLRCAAGLCVLVGAVDSCVPVPAELGLAALVPRKEILTDFKGVPKDRYKVLAVAARVVPKNPQSSDPWYCEDDWRFDPGFETALAATWSDDPFYVAVAGLVQPTAYRLESGLEARAAVDWKTGAGF